MYTYSWYHWLTFFYIYCFCGWIFESTYVSLRKHHFVNRGFLRLPMLPLYGTGAVMMLWVSLPFQNNLFLIYISGVIAATLLEYATGYVMERLFKIKYWDYSNQHIQLNGYICLSSSIAWGFLTIFLTKIIHKPIAELVLSLPPAVEFCFLFVVTVVFLYDTVQSTREALALGRALEALTKMKAELEEAQVQLALLKAETSQRVEELKLDAGLLAVELKADTLQKAAEIREETVQRALELKSETLQKAAELKDGTLQKATELKDGTLQKATELKDGTLQKAAELKDGTLQKATELKDGTLQKAAEFREEAASLMAVPRAESISLLMERMEELREKRQNIFSHTSNYRKGLLLGNPSASSQKFAEALKELRSSLEKKKNQ